MFFRFTVSENEKIWNRFHSTWEWPQTRRPADVHQTRHPSTCRWTMQWRCFKDLTWMAMELWVLMNCESRLQAKKCRESDNHVTCIVYIFFVENRSAVLLHCAGLCTISFQHWFWGHLQWWKLTFQSTGYLAIDRFCQVASYYRCPSNGCPAIIWSHWHQFRWQLWHVTSCTYES